MYACVCLLLHIWTHYRHLHGNDIIAWDDPLRYYCLRVNASFYEHECMCIQTFKNCLHEDRQLILWICSLWVVHVDTICVGRRYLHTCKCILHACIYLCMCSRLSKSMCTHVYGHTERYTSTRRWFLISGLSSTRTDFSILTFRWTDLHSTGLSVSLL